MGVTEEIVSMAIEKPQLTPIPPEHRRRYVHRLEFLCETWIETTHDIPSYYLADHEDRRAKVKIGVSFEITRKRRIKEHTLGRLFYPIVLENGFTGNSFSINAPFVLNTLRSGLAPENELNTLLLKQAATLIADLFRNILLRRFGVVAYGLLIETSASNVPSFLEVLYDSLRDQQCILNNTYVKGSKINYESMFCEGDQYVPCSIIEQNGVKQYYPAKDLYGFISDNKYITCEIQGVDLLGLLVSKLDAKPFTIHDVVSLKVNDHTRKKPPFEGWRFTSEDKYISEMVCKKRQVKYADAINRHFEELTDSEKTDLGSSYSWLSESGHLKPISGDDHLFQWKGKVPEVPGFHWDDLIHHCICSHPLMKKLHATPYDVNKALLNATIPKLERDEFDGAKKLKLFNFLVDNASKLSRKVVKVLKGYRIFLDSKRRFVEFNRLVRASKGEKEVFGDAISIPCKKILKSKIFLKRFRIRQKINNDDILRKAEQLFEDVDAIDRNDVLLFEAYLNKRELNPRLASRLKEVFMVVCGGNKIANPQSKPVYYDTKKMRRLLGNDRLYAEEKFRRLFRKLGVKFRPLSEHIMDFLMRLREAGLPPPNRSLLYVELTKALAREGIDLREHRAEEIISIQGEYHKPKDVFLERTFRSLLLGSKVYLSAKGKLRKALVELGCKLKPIDEDYIDFLRWVSSKLQECTGEGTRKKYISVIQYVYSKIQSTSGIGIDDRVVLTHDEQMVSRRDVVEQRVHLDDNPQLSREIKLNEIPVWFVNCGPEGYGFIEAIGVPRLSDSVRLKEKLVEGSKSASDTMILRLKSPKVIDAIQSMVQQNDEWRNDLNSEDWAKSILDLQFVKFAESIKKTFVIGNHEFTIDTGCCLDRDTAYFAKNLQPPEMRDALAIEISNVVLTTKHHRASLADAIYRFLEGNITQYLGSRGYVLEERLKKPDRIPLDSTLGQVGERKTIGVPQGLATDVEEKAEVDELDSEEEREIQIEIVSHDSVENRRSTGGQSKGQRLAERFRTADISYKWITLIEESDDPNCSAFDVSDKDLGYDVEVRKDDEITKMIEVKSSKHSDFPGSIIMTPNEWRTAKDNVNCYWLYVVRDVRKENKSIKPEEIKNRVKKFEDPYRLFKDTAIFEKRVVTKSEQRVVIKLDNTFFT